MVWWNCMNIRFQFCTADTVQSKFPTGANKSYLSWFAPIAVSDWLSRKDTLTWNDSVTILTVFQYHVNFFLRCRSFFRAYSKKRGENNVLFDLLPVINNMKFSQKFIFIVTSRAVSGHTACSWAEGFCVVASVSCNTRNKLLLSAYFNFCLSSEGTAVRWFHV